MVDEWGLVEWIDPMMPQISINARCPSGFNSPPPEGCPKGGVFPSPGGVPEGRGGRWGEHSGSFYRRGQYTHTTTPSGCACHQVQRTSWPLVGFHYHPVRLRLTPLHRRGILGGVVVGGSMAVIFIMPIPGEESGMAGRGVA